MDLSCGQGLVGTTAQAWSLIGGGGGGTRCGELPVGWVSPHPTAPPQGRVQQLLSTDLTQQTAGAPLPLTLPRGLTGLLPPDTPLTLG